MTSVEPLVSAEALQVTKRHVQDFASKDGWGPTLQERLLAFDRQQSESWLASLWLQKAYLEYRESVLINVNWWAEFADHPKHPAALLESPPAKGDFSQFQLRRAAGFIYDALKYKRLLEAQVIPPEYTRDGTPIAMDQYTRIFSATRVPRDACDELRHVFPSPARHITLCVLDQVYELEVIPKNNTPYTITELEQLLQRTVQLALSLKDRAQPAVGLMTSEHRDTWATAYKELRAANGAALDSIETSLFAVALDNYSAPSRELSPPNLFHGINAHNRWFDKAVCFILTSDGRAGVNAEHSASDATVPAAFLTYILAKEAKAMAKIDDLFAVAADVARKTRDNPAASPEEKAAAAQAEALAREALARHSPVRDPAPRADLPAPKHLTWTLTESFKQRLVAAEARAQKHIRDTAMQLYWHKDLGSQAIKRTIKKSPDGVVQMALQLAYYRVHGKVCPTYETATHRLFRAGRTECGRSCTNASRAFVERMGGAGAIGAKNKPSTALPDGKDVASKESVAQKRAAFEEALRAHSEYMKEASNGRGIDRHFLGLRSMMEPDVDAKTAKPFPPGIFQDPSFAYTTWNFNLSTVSIAPWLQLIGTSPI